MSAKMEGIALPDNLLDLAFTVSSTVAEAFSALSDLDYERQLVLSVQSVETIARQLHLSDTGSRKHWMSALEFTNQQLHMELEECLLEFHNISLEDYSPQLEKACI